MKDIMIFKKKALAVLSTGIILTSFAGCNLDENNLIESENPKQSSVEMMEETKANETEKASKKESIDENNNLRDKIKAHAIALSTMLSAIVALKVILSKEKDEIKDEELKLDSKKKYDKQKTYHR
ncbi:MAG: hypothetical protein HFI87_05635 [Bacilli bacterium]|nr:hypothetical protein [Bacilli bacterium]